MERNRLLVVDDEMSIAALITATAMDCGYDAKIAVTAHAFKNEFLSFQPTLIALDLCMPGEDGIELLRYLADHECKAGILIVSGFDQRVLEGAVRLGTTRGLRMLGTIPKPFRLASLQELFNALRREPTGI